MFCPNCGNDCATMKFCPMCGTKLPQKSEEVQAAERRVWEIPAGVYKTFGGYIALGPTWMEIHKKKSLNSKDHTIKFPYTQLTGVSYGRNHGLDGGFAAVRWEGNRDLPMPKNFGEALWDATSIQTDSLNDLLFYHICCFLYTFVNPSSGDAPVYALECYDDLPSTGQDLSSYYENYNPYRDKAIAALRENTYMTRKEATRLIDAYFDKKQKAEYAEDATAALRDLNIILGKPDKERREQLESANLVYCPKCFSGSVFCEKKGFDFATAWLAERILPGRGFLLGGFGANKLQCKCLNCGHTWEP